MPKIETTEEIVRTFKFPADAEEGESGVIVTARHKDGAKPSANVTISPDQTVKGLRKVSEVCTKAADWLDKKAGNGPE